MFIIRFVISTGLINWARRYGFDNNDKANGVFSRGSFVYVVGESDSTGWTSSKTDMVLLKLDSSTGTLGTGTYAKYIGGTQEDTALKVICDTDDSVYTLGEGFSVELTFGTKDIFLMRLSSSGSLDYFYNFGGTNPDYAADLKLWVNNLYILGHSQSSALTSGFLDIFIISCDKNTPSNAKFVKYIGTSSFNEYGGGLTLTSQGTVYFMGQISAAGYTNGNNDIFMAGLTKDGVLIFTNYLGGSISETPGDIQYNPIS